VCAAVAGREGCVGGGADGERKDAGVFGAERGVVVPRKVRSDERSQVRTFAPRKVVRFNDFRDPPSLLTEGSRLNGRVLKWMCS